MANSSSNLIVNQFHSGTACGDAITDEMLALRKALQGVGYESNIYAEHIAGPLTDTIRDIRTYGGSARNVLLVHHSMGFDCFDKIAELPDRKILIYHNITPPEFFSGSPFTATYAAKGRDQLLAYRRHVDFAFANSEYTRRELDCIGFKQTDILPITFALEELRRVNPNPSLVETLGSTNNFLFVGRIAPNKKQEDVIRTFSYYHKNVNSNSRLFLVGGFEGSDGYYGLLRALAEEVAVEGSVFFPGRVSAEDLVTYYKYASLFLSMSEHEGFCVPLVESMLFGVPILAYSAAAVPFTLGGAGVLFTSKDIPLVAEMAHYLLTDNGLRCRALETQRQRLEELNPERFIPRLRTVIEALACRAALPVGATSATIQIQGPFETSYSLAIVNRNLARALNAKTGVDVNLHATEGPGDYIPRTEDLADKPEVERLWRKSSGAPPARWVIRNMYPPRVSDVDPSQLNFFYFYWEDSLLPGEWADAFNRHLDGLMVPSRHVRKALQDSGVAIPIEIILTGVESPFRDGQKITPLKLDTEKRFKFLHVSSGFPRKGCDVLLRAYVEEFSLVDDVCLVVKTFPNIHNTMGVQIQQLRSEDRRCPEILHLDRDMNAEEMSSLYKSASSLVHPARAEGFGLPVAEAMLAHLPVIVTNYSGLTEFCNDKTALLVDYKLAKSGSHFNLEGAEWAEPDVAQLRRHMREIYRNPESCDKMVDRAASNIRNRFTWSRVADRALTFMHSMQNERVRPIKAGMVTSWNSICGIAEYSKYLLDAISDDRITWTILAQEVEQSLCDESGEVVRCWTDRWHGNLGRVLHEVNRFQLDMVHFQFNFGFFELDDFSRAIVELKRQGRKVLITLHSTRDATVDGLNISLAQIASGLMEADRILVHNQEDRRRLADWGIHRNVSIFPHGFPCFEHRDRHEIRRQLSVSKSPVVSAFGFLTPHKGLLELIEALVILKQEFPGVMLLALTAFHPHAPSKEYYQACTKRIAELGLRDCCLMITAFLAPEEAITALQASDVVVLPYHSTKESSSAAVRFALAARRPVITTQQPVFSDVAEVVCQIEASSPVLIAEAIARVLNDPKLGREMVKRSEVKMSRESWQNVARLYSKIIKAMFRETIEPTEPTQPTASS